MNLEERKLKKRMISLLLCLCMVFSLLPTAVLAADGENPDNTTAGSGQVTQQNSEDLGDQSEQNGLNDSEDLDDSAIPAVVAESGEGATTTEVPELENPATSGTSGGIDWKVEKGTLTITPSSNPEGDFVSGQMVENYGTLTKKAPGDADYIAALTAAGYTPSKQGYFYYPGTETWVSDSPWKFLSKEITKVVVEDGVTSIAARAFRLPNVTEVSIPATVKSIGNLVFEACEKLMTVNWTGNWEGHAPMAFNGFSRCSSLGNGDELTDWMRACFYVNGQSDSIEGTQFTVDVDKLNKRLRNATATYPRAMFRSVPKITSATLTSQLNVDYIFEYSGIQSVTIADDQTSIAIAAFRGCEGLTSVTIPASVTVIHMRAFADSGLKNITFSGSTSPTFGSFVFENVKLDSVTLDENMSVTEAVKIIGELAKEGAITDSTTITPAKFANFNAENVVVDGAEGEAINRQSYPLVKNLTINGAYTSATNAFGNSNWGQETLENLTIHAPGEDVTINATAFLRTPLKSVKIEAKKLTFTGDAAFLNTMLLTHIDLTGVGEIVCNTNGKRTFAIGEYQNGGLSAPTRYVYFKNATARNAMSSQFSGNANTYYLVTNDGSVDATKTGFAAVYRAGYTAEWYEKEDFSGTPYTGTPEEGKTYYAKWIEHIPERPTKPDKGSDLIAGLKVKVKCTTENSGHEAKEYAVTSFTDYVIGEPTNLTDTTYTCTVTLPRATAVAKYNDEIGTEHTDASAETNVTWTLTYSNGKWRADDTSGPEIHVVCVEKPALPTVEKVGRSGFNFECSSTGVQHNTTKYSPYSEIRRLQVTLDSHPNAYRIISDEAQLGTDPNGKPRYYFEVEVDVTAYIEDFDYHTGREHTLCSDQSETLTLTFWLYDSGSWNQWRAATAYVECAETDIPPVPTRERFYDFTYAIDCVDDASHSTNVRMGNSFGYDRTVCQDGEGYYIQLVIDAESYIRSYNRSQQAAGRTHVRTGDQPASVTAKIYYDKENNRWPVAGTVTTIRVSCIQPPTVDEIRQALNMEEPSVTVKCVTTKPAAHEEKAYAPVIGLPANAQAGERVDWFGQNGYLVELDTAAFVNAYAAEEGIGEHSAKTGTPDTLTWVVYWNRAASDNGTWMAEPYEMDDASAAKNSVIEVTHKKPADVHLRIYKSSDLAKAVKDVRYPCSLVEGNTLDLSEIDIAKIYAGEYEIDAGWYDDYRFGLYKDYLAGKRDTKPADMTELEINGNWQNLHLVITDTHKVVYFGSAEDLAAYQNNHDASLIVSSTRARVGAELPTADAPTATRTGYTFKFWSREGQTGNVSGQTVNGWTNLYANWEKIPDPTKENIEFNGKDKVYVKCDIYGTHAELIAYDQGEYDILPTSDTTANLVFKSATYLAASKYANDHALATASDPEVSTQIEFKDGKWRQLKNGPTVQVRCKVTLTYDANAPEDKTVTNMPDPLKVTQTLDEGSTTTFYLSENIPACEGYVFIGWTSNKTQPGSTIPVEWKTKNNGANWKTTTGYPGYTLYAVWQKLTPVYAYMQPMHKGTALTSKDAKITAALKGLGFEEGFNQGKKFVTIGKTETDKTDLNDVSKQVTDEIDNGTFAAYKKVRATTEVLAKIDWNELKLVDDAEHKGYTDDGKIEGYHLNGTLSFCDVQFKPNGDNVKNMPADVYHLQYTDIALATPTREGYTFKGWSVQEDKPTILDASNGAGTLVKDSFYVRNDTIFTAQWEAETYTITYDYRDKDIRDKAHLQPTNPKTYTVEDTVTLNPITAKGTFGKTFLEWRWDTNGDGVADTALTEIPKGTTGNLTIYAYWNIPVNYTVYDENDQKVDEFCGTDYVAEGTFAKYDVRTCTKTGYDFDGWYEFKKDIGDEGPRLSKLSEGKEKWELVGKLTAKKYTVTFDPHGGTIEKDKETKTVTYDAPYGELPTPTREGYTFEGWYLSKTEFTPANKVEATTIVKATADHTLYANWTANTYKVTFDPNRGTIEKGKETKTVTYDALYGELPTPTRTGYTFNGWYLDGKEITAGSTVKKAEDHTLTASWSINSHWLTIKYLNKSNGKELAPEYSQKHDYDTTVKVKSPSIPGYKFYDREDETVVVTMPDEDVTRIVYYVRKTGNGGGTYDSPNKTKKTSPALTLNTADHFAFINGYPDGSVQPEGNVTRAETAAILYRIMGDDCQSYYKTTSCSYSDVARGDWFNTYVATLENAGVIVDTRTNGKFRPNETITRAELAAMLAQFADTKSAPNYFTDVTANYWAANAIAVCAKLGWINGYPDGTFRPDQTVTRAEMMAMINRALERTPKSAADLLSGMKTWSDNANTGAWYYLDVQEATNSHTYTKSGSHETWKKLR